MKNMMNETLNHLGHILDMLVDLVPDERCDALNNALDFYNKQRPQFRVVPHEGYKTFLVHQTPLDNALSFEASMLTFEQRLKAAVWMVGNIDTDIDKAQWWATFQSVWDEARADPNIQKYADAMYKDQVRKDLPRER